MNNKLYSEIEQILDNLEEYFDNRSDADWDYETSRFIPNKDMRLLSEVKKLKEYLLNNKK